MGSVMSDFSSLSRRERQIMEILYAAGGATVAHVVTLLPNAPTDQAVRRLMEILEEKGHLRRRKVGREFVYLPKHSKLQAGRRALRRLLDTFFDGSLDKAFAVHLGDKGARVSDEQLVRIARMIQVARREGR